jgi:hypothetical protein
MRESAYLGVNVEKKVVLLQQPNIKIFFIVPCDPQGDGS